MPWQEMSPECTRGNPSNNITAKYILPQSLTLVFCHETLFTWLSASSPRRIWPCAPITSHLVSHNMKLLKAKSLLLNTSYFTSRLISLKINLETVHPKYYRCFSHGGVYPTVGNSWATVISKSVTQQRMRESNTDKIWQMALTIRIKCWVPVASR